MKDGQLQLIDGYCYGLDSPWLLKILNTHTQHLPPDMTVWQSTRCEGGSDRIGSGQDIYLPFLLEPIPEASGRSSLASFLFLVCFGASPGEYSIRSEKWLTLVNETKTWHLAYVCFQRRSVTLLGGRQHTRTLAAQEANIQDLCTRKRTPRGTERAYLSIQFFFLFMRVCTFLFRSILDDEFLVPRVVLFCFPTQFKELQRWENKEPSRGALLRKAQFNRIDVMGMKDINHHFHCLTCCARWLSGELGYARRRRVIHEMLVASARRTKCIDRK